jgi:S-DNA-T family DNA segregation ATPase FtsK/SpoIIIE
MLQRRLRIGYTRAARLVDTMEEKGIISPPQPNSQVREVLDYGPAAPPKEE